MTDDLDRRVAEWESKNAADVNLGLRDAVLLRDLNADRHYWRERTVDAQKAMSEATLALAKAERERDEWKARYERLIRDPAIAAEATALALIEALDGGDHD